MRSSFTTPATPELYTLSLHDALPISAAACYGLADPSHSGNTQCAVMHVLPHQQIDAPLIPLARVHELVALHYAPCSRHQKSESEIGGGVGEAIGRIRHQHLSACCGGG